MKSTIATAKLSQLAKSPLNVREKTPDAQIIDQLAASILARGLIQPLAVHRGNGLAKGKMGVLAGSRRWHAILKLKKDGARMDRGYMMGKLMGMGIREAMDVEEAFTALKGLLVDSARDRGTHDAPKFRQQIADVREAIDFGIDVYDLSTLLSCWSNITGRDDWDLTLQKTSPTAIQFWDRLWRPFIASLTASERAAA